MSDKPLLVISSFPDKGQIHSTQTVGVASYTKNLLLAVAAQQPKRPITVWAEQITDYQNYQEQTLTVQRRWRRGSCWSLTQLLPALVRQRHQQVLVAFEINMFGGVLATGWMVLLLIIARACGVKVNLMMHQVVADFVPLEGDNLVSHVKNVIKNIFYSLLKLASARIIVFEAQLADNLHTGKKVVVIPHFVYQVPAISQKEARKQLGWAANKPYLLCFGYIAPYKGIKELLEIWPTGSDWQLIIAGGMNPNHQDNPTQVAYFNAVKQLAETKNITITGFVPEAKMPDYFAACTAMIFPYKIFMSSSGPLSLAFAYGKPVLLSPPLAAYARTPDFRRCLHQQGLRVADLLYQESSEGLTQGLTRLSEQQNQLVALAHDMAQARSLATIAGELIEKME